MEDKRDTKGRFVKGMIGNPKGRPKKSVKLLEMIQDPDTRKLYRNNPLEALLFLMNNAETPEDLRKYAKDVIDYVTPRLSSVKTEIKKVSKFIVERSDGRLLGEIKSTVIDVTPDNQYHDSVKSEAEGVLKKVSKKVTKKQTNK